MTGRGRGRPKGRRPRRGGASAGDSSTHDQPGSSTTATPLDNVASTAPETPSAVEINTNQPLSEPAPALTTAPAAAAAAAGPSEALPQASAATASRPTAAPGARGKKQLAFQPTFKGRRSKEEREALKREAWEREQERRADEASVQRTASLRARGGQRGRGDRGRGGGRGGYMGDNGSVAGPLSMGSAPKDSRRFPQRQRTEGFGIGGPSSIKREEGMRGEDIQLDSSGIKQDPDDYGYISSDPDEHQGPRRNVDEIINLVSSDDDAPGSDPSSRASSLYPKAKRVKHGLVPIRVFRTEHRDRVMGINTEASSTGGVSAENRADRDSSGDLSSDDPSADISKGKSKARLSNDSELMSNKPFKGMWQDDDSEVDQITIRKGTDQQDIEIPDADVEDATAGDGIIIKEPPSSPEMRKRSQRPAKTRNKSSIGRPRGDIKPVLQTEAEKQEWARIEADRKLLIHELQHAPTSLPTAGEPNAAEGSEAQPQSLLDQKTDRVYLFQLPPIIPDLGPVPNSVKNEPSSPTAAMHNIPVVSSSAAVSSDDHAPDSSSAPGVDSTDQTIKIEEDMPFNSTSDGGPTFPSGRVGKLRLHKSGRVTLDWGGTSMEVQKGMDPRFLQDVVLMKVLPESERNDGANGKPREGTYSGEAMNFGQVRGKFVVLPDWDKILGQKTT